MEDRVPVHGIQIKLASKGENHYGKICLQMKSSVHAITPSDQSTVGGNLSEVQSDGVQELPMGTVTGAPRVEDSARFSNLLVGGKPIKFKLDTGTETTALSLSVH